MVVCKCGECGTPISIDFDAWEKCAEEIENGHPWISAAAASSIIRKHAQQYFKGIHKVSSPSHLEWITYLPRLK